MTSTATAVPAAVRVTALVRVYGMLLAEAPLMGVVGPLVGVRVRLLCGWATTRVMFTGFASVIPVPTGQLVGYVAPAAVTASCCRPGRRPPPRSSRRWET